MAETSSTTTSGTLKGFALSNARWYPTNNGNKNETILPKWQEKFYNIAMNLKESRKQLGLTQPEAASLLGIPFRTYCRYEDQPQYEGTFKYNQIVSVLDEKAKSVVLKIDVIKKAVFDACSKYKVSACYLFGSYAKEKARSDSDIDLMIVSELEGIEYYQLLGELEDRLKKKIDLIRLETATQNVKLMNEILKDGVKIYG